MIERFLDHSPRLLFLIALACLAALGSALVAQHVYDVRPCPWCVLQRLIFMGIAVVCLAGGVVALCVKTGRARQQMVRWFSAPLVLLALAGLVAATYQHEVAAESASCALSMPERVLTYFDLETRWPEVFMITANCNEAGKYRLLGLPYEIWSGLMYLMCLAIGLALLLRRPGENSAHAHSQFHSRL